MLRRAERTGELDFALASCLADVYGSTTDCLAGRRPDRRQQSSLGVLRAERLERADAPIPGFSAGRH